MTRERVMKGNYVLRLRILAVLAILGTIALAAQDK
jgi:hypothetical protein